MLIYYNLFKYHKLPTTPFVQSVHTAQCYPKLAVSVSEMQAHRGQ